jgi:hypothetical protein
MSDLADKEKLLTEGIALPAGQQKIADAIVGRFKRLIFGHTCTKCGSTEVYRYSALVWGPYGGYTECGGCRQRADMFEVPPRLMNLQVFVINEDGSETPVPQTVDPFPHPKFRSNHHDKNWGKVLRYWIMEGKEWKELEVPHDQRPTKRVWQKYHPQEEKKA